MALLTRTPAPDGASPFTREGLMIGSPATPAGAGSGAGAARVPGPPPAPPVIDIKTVVNQAVAKVRLPEPTIELGPEPEVNEWNMLAVGQPVWLWTSSPKKIDASESQQGITVKLVAEPAATTINLGDGTTLRCKTGTPRPANAEPLAKSPDCGHTWLKAGNYTVKASTGWNIRWSALGQSGTVPMERSTSRTVEVGELASVVVR